MATISRVDLKRDPGPEADMPLTVSFSKINFVAFIYNKILGHRISVIFCFLNSICGNSSCCI